MSVPKDELGHYRRYAIFRAVLKLQGKVLLVMFRRGWLTINHPDNEIYKALSDCSTKLLSIIEKD